MQGIELTKAKKYNKRKAGKLWNQKDLPWPLSMNFPHLGFQIDVASDTFVFVAAAFQKMHGLLPDGQIGPATLAVINTTETIIAESEVGHDFESEDEKDIAIPKIRTVSTSPARPGVSNCVIINGKSIPLPNSMVQMGMTASNYQDDGDHQFTQYRKRTRVTAFVLHESVTMSVPQTNRILDKKRERSARKGQNNGKGYDYGIHLNLAPDGHISCHADLVLHHLVHAGYMNASSFGIEVVNPYNPAFGGAPFNKVIDGPWWCWNPKKGDKVYTLPTPAQMRVIFPLVKFLTEAIDTLPLEFPTAGLNSRNRRIEGWKDGAKTKPGIVAHRDFASHADGRYMLEYCIDQNSKPLHERD